MSSASHTDDGTRLVNDRQRANPEPPMRSFTGSIRNCAARLAGEDALQSQIAEMRYL